MEFQVLYLTISSQCLLSKNVKRASPATISNILLKVNLKLGGINFGLDNLGAILDDRRCATQIIGASISHNSKPGCEDPSAASFVGTLDTRLQQFDTVNVILDARESIVAFSKQTVSAYDQLHEEWQKVNGRSPDRVVYIRESVGGDRTSDIIREELKALERAYRDSEVILIVLQKRHGVRFFVKDGAANVPPGTAVDGPPVCARDSEEFYLAGQFGAQGVSRVPHYKVIHNSAASITQSDIMELMFILCCSYQRCTKSVSLPCFNLYAGLAALRVTLHLANTKLPDLNPASGPQRNRGRPTKRSLEASEMTENVKKNSRLRSGLYYC